MNTQTTSDEYMLFFRGHDWHKGLSPEVLQATMEKLNNWIGSLQERGKFVGAQPLGDEGKLVSGKYGRIVADGPFAESKESVGGYLQVRAESLDEALAIAQACPSLEYGVSIEVRPALEECPVVRQMKERGALATA